MATPLSALTDQERAQAVARFEIVRPFFHEHIPLTQMARQHRLPLRTLTRWVQRYRAEGLAGLVRKRRRDHGHHRLLPPCCSASKAWRSRRPPLSVRAIHRHVSDLASQHALKPPSYGLVYAMVHHLSPALITLAHHGPKAYAQQFDRLYRREADGPNALWQADHCLLDLLSCARDRLPRSPG